jgi:hypothetical protein
LTTAQKRNLIEERGNRCEICGEKYPSRVLEVHHKRAVARWGSRKGLLDFNLFYEPKKPTCGNTVGNTVGDARELRGYHHCGGSAGYRG